MDKVYNFFKFLEKKEGRVVPFLYKLLTPDYTWEDKDLFVPKDLRLSTVDIPADKHIVLPDNLTIGGNLHIFHGVDITELPDNLTIGGYLSMEKNTGIHTIPKNLRVGASFFIEGSALARENSLEEILTEIRHEGGRVEHISSGEGRNVHWGDIFPGE